MGTHQVGVGIKGIRSSLGELGKYIEQNYQNENAFNHDLNHVESEEMPFLKERREQFKKT